MLWDVCAVPAFRQGKEKKKINVAGLFFFFSPSFCFVLLWSGDFIFSRILPLSPVVPGSSSLPQKMIAMIISRLISFSKECSGAPRPRQNSPRSSAGPWAGYKQHWEMPWGQHGLERWAGRWGEELNNKTSKQNILLLRLETKP